MNGALDLGTRCSYFWVCRVADRVLGSKNYLFLVRVQVAVEHRHCGVTVALSRAGYSRQ